MSGVGAALETLARPRVGLPAILLLTTVFFVLFCAVDRRPPNDHDDFYTGNSTWALQDYVEAPFTRKPGVLWDHFRRGELHPRFAQTTLVASLGTFGRTRFVYRATNLPFLLLLVLGTWLLARQLASEKLALLAAFVTACVPMIINYSRKWDIQFHAAALTPIGLWLGIAALRADGRRATKLWIGFGLWQGIRLYTHPIVLPDVVLTLGCIGAAALLQGKAAGRPLKPILARCAASLGACFLAALYYLGIARVVLGEPEYSLRRYLTQRGSYSETGWWFESDLLAKLNHLHDLVGEVVWLQVMPLDTVLLGPGLLLLPLLLLSRKAWTGEPPGQRWLLAAAVIPSMAQVPAVVLATSNRAFLNDWLFVVPGLVIGALITLRMAARQLGRAERPLVLVWAVALVLAGLAHHLVPMGGRLLLPDPIEDHPAYGGNVLGPFVRSSSGRVYTTHHVPTRYRFAGPELARAVADLDPGRTGPARFTVLDLSWDPAIEGKRGCRLGDPGSAGTWSWAPPAGLNVWAREVSPWPFVFEGFPGMRSVRPDHELDIDASNWAVFRPDGTVHLEGATEVEGEVTLPILGGDEERAAGTAEEAGAEGAEEQPSEPEPLQPAPEPEEPLARITVVRMWMVLAPFWDRETFACKPDERLPDGFFDAARERVEERFPGATSRDRLLDPTGWLLGRSVEWDRTRAYLGTALLYDLGESASEPVTSIEEPEAPPEPSIEDSIGDGDQVEGELDRDLPGNDGDPPSGGEPVEPIEAGGQ
jgi:hypothetical protein